VSRDVVFAFLGIMMGVLLVDMLVARRNHVVRIAGHNIAHMMFLIALYIIVSKFAGPVDYYETLTNYRLPHFDRDSRRWYLDFLPFRPNASYQLFTGIATAVAYVLWGIIHHALEKDLHHKIVIEYMLVGAIAIVLLVTILGFLTCLPKGVSMKGVILAGGYATRLRPLTLVTNKHLLPIYNKPMVYYPLEAMAKAGVTEVLLTSSPDHAGILPIF